jgi:hypothetical protein
MAELPQRKGHTFRLDRAHHHGPLTVALALFFHDVFLAHPKWKLVPGTSALEAAVRCAERLEQNPKKIPDGVKTDMRISKPGLRELTSIHDACDMFMHGAERSSVSPDAKRLSRADAELLLLEGLAAGIAGELTYTPSEGPSYPTPDTIVQQLRPDTAAQSDLTLARGGIPAILQRVADKMASPDTADVGFNIVDAVVAACHRKSHLNDECRMILLEYLIELLVSEIKDDCRNAFVDLFCGTGDRGVLRGDGEQTPDIRDVVRVPTNILARLIASVHACRVFSDTTGRYEYAYCPEFLFEPGCIVGTSKRVGRCHIFHDTDLVAAFGTCLDVARHSESTAFEKGWLTGWLRLGPMGGDMALPQPLGGGVPRPTLLEHPCMRLLPSDGAVIGAVDPTDFIHRLAAVVGPALRAKVAELDESYLKIMGDATETLRILDEEADSTKKLRDKKLFWYLICHEEIAARCPLPVGGVDLVGRGNVLRDNDKKKTTTEKKKMLQIDDDPVKIDPSARVYRHLIRNAWKRATPDERRAALKENLCLWLLLTFDIGEPFDAVRRELDYVAVAAMLLLPRARRVVQRHLPMTAVSSTAKDSTNSAKSSRTQRYCVLDSSTTAYIRKDMAQLRSAITHTIKCSNSKLCAVCNLDPSLPNEKGGAFAGIASGGAPQSSTQKSKEAVVTTATTKHPVCYCTAHAKYQTAKRCLRPWTSVMTLILGIMHTCASLIAFADTSKDEQLSLDKFVGVARSGTAESRKQGYAKFLADTASVIAGVEYGRARVQNPAASRIRRPSTKNPMLLPHKQRAELNGVPADERALYTCDVRMAMLLRNAKSKGATPFGPLDWYLGSALEKVPYDGAIESSTSGGATPRPTDEAAKLKPHMCDVWCRWYDMAIADVKSTRPGDKNRIRRAKAFAALLGPNFLSVIASYHGTDLNAQPPIMLDVLTDSSKWKSEYPDLAAPSPSSSSSTSAAAASPSPPSPAPSTSIEQTPQDDATEELALPPLKCPGPWVSLGSETLNMVSRMLGLGRDIHGHQKRKFNPIDHSDGCVVPLYIVNKAYEHCAAWITPSGECSGGIDGRLDGSRPKTVRWRLDEGTQERVDLTLSACAASICSFLCQNSQDLEAGMPKLVPRAPCTRCLQPSDACGIWFAEIDGIPRLVVPANQQPDSGRPSSGTKTANASAGPNNSAAGRNPKRHRKSALGAGDLDAPRVYQAAMMREDAYIKSLHTLLMGYTNRHPRDDLHPDIIPGPVTHCAPLSRDTAFVTRESQREAALIILGPRFCRFHTGAYEYALLDALDMMMACAPSVHRSYQNIYHIIHTLEDIIALFEWTNPRRVQGCGLEYDGSVSSFNAIPTDTVKNGAVRAATILCILKSVLLQADGNADLALLLLTKYRSHNWAFRQHADSPVSTAEHWATTFWGQTDTGSVKGCAISFSNGKMDIPKEDVLKALRVCTVLTPHVTRIRTYYGDNNVEAEVFTDMLQHDPLCQCMVQSAYGALPYQAASTSVSAGPPPMQFQGSGQPPQQTLVYATPQATSTSVSATSPMQPHMFGQPGPVYTSYPAASTSVSAGPPPMQPHMFGQPGPVYTNYPPASTSVSASPPSMQSSIFGQPGPMYTSYPAASTSVSASPPPMQSSMFGQPGPMYMSYPTASTSVSASPPTQFQGSGQPPQQAPAAASLSGQPPRFLSDFIQTTPQAPAGSTTADPNVPATRASPLHE